MAEITLQSGHKMPILGFGLSQVPKTETKEIIIKAVRAGYTHIDAASVYKNESELGEALEELFSSGEKRREDLFITTKCFMTKYRNVRAGLNASLQRLRLTYVDQYLLHWPFALEDDGSEPPKFSKKLDRYPLHLVWPQMEELKREGLIKSIGVSNWTVALLNDMLAFAQIPPDVNQIEINPYNKKLELVEFCLNNGVVPVAYRVICGSDLKFANMSKCVIDDPVVIEVSRKYGKTPAQILIAWCLNRKCVVLAKTLSEERMRENLEVRDLVMDQEDIDKINSLPNQGEYICPYKLGGIHIYH